MNDRMNEEWKGLEASLSENLPERICNKCRAFRAGEMSKESIVNSICVIMCEEGRVRWDPPPVGHIRKSGFNDKFRPYFAFSRVRALSRLYIMLERRKWTHLSAGNQLWSIHTQIEWDTRVKRHKH